MKISPVGGNSCSMRMDRQTDRQIDRQTDTEMTKLTVAYRNFANAPRNERKITHCKQNVEVVNAKDAGT